MNDQSNAVMDDKSRANLGADRNIQSDE